MSLSSMPMGRSKVGSGVVFIKVTVDTSAVVSTFMPCMVTPILEYFISFLRAIRCNCSSATKFVGYDLFSRDLVLDSISLNKFSYHTPPPMHTYQFDLYLYDKLSRNNSQYLIDCYAIQAQTIPFEKYSKYTVNTQ